MMIIAVISDSHGNKNSISKVKGMISNAEVLIFLGDERIERRGIRFL